MEFKPAFVDSWDGVTLRVFIEGYTDGADIGMKAEVLFPFSDRPDYTGFHIERGDPVWVVFNNDDSNQPIVIGFRNFNTGENKTTRRWRHVNIETHATKNCLNTSNNHDIKAKNKVMIEASEITLKASQINIIGNFAGKGGDSLFDGSMKVTKTIEASDCISGGISGNGHVHGGGPKPSN